MIVHILERGMPLCRFSSAVPAEWPPGHKWVGRDDAQSTTCAGCKSVDAHLIARDTRAAVSDLAPVLEAAKAVCRARCSVFDRDAGCQEGGRCGDNWRVFIPLVAKAITEPVF